MKGHSISCNKISAGNMLARILPIEPPFRQNQAAFRMNDFFATMISIMERIPDKGDNSEKVAVFDARTFAGIRGCLFIDRIL
jgi:hypothetical protein